MPEKLGQKVRAALRPSAFHELAHVTKNKPPRNYPEALHRILKYGQVELLISALREIEPGLGNEPVFAHKPTPGFAAMASRI